MESPLLLSKIMCQFDGISQVVLSNTNEPLPEHQLHAPLMYFPLLLGTTERTIPSHVPYARADAGLVQKWRAKLAEVRGYRVGICWGASLDTAFTGRSFSPALFVPLARIPGVRLISLQKGRGASRIGELADIAPVIKLNDFDEDPRGAFMDTAAVMANLDLVISCDTSVAHLAGATATPTWLVLPTTSDWRWLLAREDTPWYPTMRLFRQRHRGDWEPVFERMAQELQQRTG
jgi:hypothetical protein